VLRILHVIDSLGPGGAQLVLENTVRFSDRSRFAHTVAALHGRGVYADKLEALGVPVLSFADSRKDPRLVWNFVSAVRLIKPHAVHLHLAASCFLGEWLKPFFPRGTRLVCNLQNVYRDNRDFPYQNALEALTYRRSDALIACSRAVARSLRLKRRSHARLHIVYNGVDEALLSGGDQEERLAMREALGLSNRQVVVLSACRLATQKNLDYGLEVMGALRRLGRTPVYVIAGTGPEEERLLAKAKQLGLGGDAVRFLGYRTDVARLLRAADFYLMPSLFEGLPLVLAEAMGSGAVCVVTPFDVIPEMIRDGKTGVVIPFKNADAAAEKIAAAIDAPEALQAMSRRALKVARRQFSAQQMARRVEKIYAAL